MFSEGLAEATRNTQSFLVVLDLLDQKNP